MKWSVMVKKNDDSKRMIESVIDQPIVNFGIEIGRVVNYASAKNDKTGTEAYFVEMIGNPLYFLWEFIELQLIRRSNSVYPFWITERGWA